MKFKFVKTMSLGPWVWRPQLGFNAFHRNIGLFFFSFENCSDLVRLESNMETSLSIGDSVFFIPWPWRRSRSRVKVSKAYDSLYPCMSKVTRVSIVALVPHLLFTYFFLLFSSPWRVPLQDWGFLNSTPQSFNDILIFNNMNLCFPSYLWQSLA